MVVENKLAHFRVHRTGTTLRNHPRRSTFLPRITALLLPLIMLTVAATTQPVSAAGASYAGADSRLQQAVAWSARQMSGGRLWIEGGATQCGKFVENAYGVTGLYPTAYDMYRALGDSGDPRRHTLSGLRDAPAGALVFFEPTARNGHNGHVGIYVGGGQFIGVGTGGHVRQHSVGWYNDNIAHFLGWAYPSAGWPGNSTAKAIGTSINPVSSPRTTAKSSAPSMSSAGKAKSASTNVSVKSRAAGHGA